MCKDARECNAVPVSVRKQSIPSSEPRVEEPTSLNHLKRPETHLRAQVMQAGGDVLGRGVTAEHMTLQDLGQVVSSHVCKIPDGKNINAYRDV